MDQAAEASVFEGNRLCGFCSGAKLAHNLYLVGAFCKVVYVGFCSVARVRSERPEIFTSAELHGIFPFTLVQLS